MKSLTFLFLTVLAVSINKCSSSDAKALKKDLIIEYDAQTRGSQSKVIVKNDSLVVMEEGRKQGVFYYKLSDKEWNSIVKEVQKIDKQKVKSYNAPTNNRASDKARTAQFRVIYKDEIHESNLFDEGNPPAELKVLVDKVADLYKNHNNRNK
jgi:hypothetical protein